MRGSPYGVGLGKIKQAAGMRRHGTGEVQDARTRATVAYDFDDTPEFVRDTVVPLVTACAAKYTRTVLTPGVRNFWAYPQPSATWCVSQPAGAGLGLLGMFSCWQPILVYGARPAHLVGSHPDTFVSTAAAEKNGHPCPKPEPLWRELFLRVVEPGALVFDPFLGSGTTLRVAKDRGHRAVGCDINERFCEIAARRMSQEVMW